MTDKQKRQAQRNDRGLAGQGDNTSGGAWARDRAIIEPEEQPATPPTAHTPAELAEQKQRHDLATGEENPG